ncbi:hypothetical protein PR048_023946 [Dryococelus australis]|uniref:4Fe-4S ferredoxin-type domain-containing protein n=1 Tax=Dryococelus australis TaxID=614101 RepID=A0ABQ9GVL1_9NEOP|nr:hypothetical protein PR048_023946 [Dryococelus australis]
MRCDVIVGQAPLRSTSRAALTLLHRQSATNTMAVNIEPYQFEPDRRDVTQKRRDVIVGQAPLRSTSHAALTLLHRQSATNTMAVNIEPYQFEPDRRDAKLRCDRPAARLSRCYTDSLRLTLWLSTSSRISLNQTEEMLIVLRAVTVKIIFQIPQGELADELGVECVNMERDEESVCCCECITLCPSSDTIILDSERHDLSLETKIKRKKRLLSADVPSNRTWCYPAYKQFAPWINAWTAIGYRNRVVIPSRVVSTIRKKVP